MAKLGARPRGPRSPAPPPPLLLLAGLALLGAARARAAQGGGFSLHPPYFNLAEGARIAASATCGEEAPARGAPRPTEDLYCKLVGGPVAGGDPNQTIQVSAGRGQGRGRAGGDAGAGDASGSRCELQPDSSGGPTRRGEPGRRPQRPRPAPPRVPHFVGPKGPQLSRSGSTKEVRVAPGGRNAAAPGEFGGGGGGGPVGGRGGEGAWSLAAPSPGIPARAELGLRGRLPVGRGRTRSAFPRDRLEPAGDRLGRGWGREGPGRCSLGPDLGDSLLKGRLEAVLGGGLASGWDPQGGRGTNGF